MSVENVQLSLFGKERRIEERHRRKQECEPKLKRKNIQEFHIGWYVRTKNSEIYRVDEILPKWKKVVGYRKGNEIANRNGRIPVIKEVRMIGTYVTDSYMIKELKRISEEDIVAQARFMIELVYKGDFVKTKNYGVCHVDKRHDGKIVTEEVFEKSGKRKKQDITSYLLIMGGKQIVKNDNIFGIVSSKLEIERFIEDGSMIKTKNERWYRVEKVMSGKVLIRNSHNGKCFFIPFSDITEVAEE